MPITHDPYLDTVRRSLNEAKIKLRKETLSDKKTVPKGFFSKNIIISDYIYLPEELQKLFLLTIFILIPYMFGIFIMYIIMGDEKFTTFNFDIFMLTWTIGYETIAFILLLLIIKSAFSFRKK